MEDLIDRVANGDVAGEEARIEARRILHTTTDAPSIRRAIGRIVRAYESDDASSARIRTSLAELGNVVERMDDALSLSPASRASKWEREEAELGRAARAQREHSDLLMLHAGCRLRAKQKNSDAWRRFCESPTHFAPALCRMSDATLLSAPPTFWFGVSIENLPLADQRLVVGRLADIKDRYGGARLPTSLWKRVDSSRASLTDGDDVLEHVLEPVVVVSEAAAVVPTEPRKPRKWCSLC
tara:strand:- start:124 stop:843 length:720 start_codon:yes stop_codon:yes gene_type:complete